jgi:CRP/FNR family transcriptional regulator, cyclic AMP receptor protein
MNSSMEKIDAHSASEFAGNLSLLREISFFSELPLETLKVLAYLCTHENFRAGDYLFRQHDDDGQAFYIISGEATLLFKDGDQSIVMGEFAKSTFVGSLALLGIAPRLFSLQARTDMTCLILTRHKFAKTMEKFPGIAPRVLQALVNSINSWERKFLGEIDTGCERCRLNIGVSLI